jgi:hypothetical protein
MGWSKTWLLLALPLAACAPDYSAVRDWSRTAAIVAEYPGVPAAAAAQPARIAALGTTPAADPARAARVEALRASQEAARTWLALLAFMADDGLLTQRGNPMGNLAARIEPADAEGAAAVRALGDHMARAAFARYRAPQLSYAVDESRDAMRGTLAAMTRLVQALEGDGAAEQAALAARFDSLAASLRDPSARALLAETRATREADLARRATLTATYLETLKRLQEGHEVLVSRVNYLSQSDTARLVRAQEAALRRAAAALPGLAI